MFRESMDFLMKKTPKRLSDAFVKSLLKLLIKGSEIQCKSLVKTYSLKFDPLIIRKDTSDIMVFWQIFKKNELELPVQTDPKLIIDAGANVGYSTLWFAQKYPKARIIAIEPEESNYEVLRKHTENYKNISIIKAGLWHKDTYLKITDPGYGEFSFMTEEVGASDKYDLKAVTINSILKEFQLDHIDILKIDIEGSEKELFSGNYEAWLDKVDILMIELHERLRKGSVKSVYSAIDSGIWNEAIKGDKRIFVRKQLKIAG